MIELSFHEISIQGTLVALGWRHEPETVIQFAGAYHVFEEQIAAALRTAMRDDQFL